MKTILLCSLILTPFHLSPVRGDRHLICKTMGDIFESGSDDGGQIRGNVQGPPGKRGPQGPKGDRGGIGPIGPKGDEAVVDYVMINATIRETAQKALERIQYLEENLGRILGCSFKIEKSCFEPLTDKRYTLEQAREACSQRNERLADITNESSLDIIMNRIRSEFMSGSSMMDFWLGMTMTPSTRKTVLSDGTDVHYLKWYPNYPRLDSANTGMGFSVHSDPRSSDQYIWNGNPTNAYHSLCQFEF